MNKEQIFGVIKENILETLPELAEKKIILSDSLKELGANSIDRAEIIIQTLSKLKLKVPLSDFGNAKNIEELVEIISSKMTAV